VIDRLKTVLTFHGGWVVFFCAAALTAIGIMAIQTTDRATGSEYHTIQIKWIPLAMIGLALMVLPKPARVAELARPMAVIGFLLLLGLVLPFTPEWIAPTRNGARGWYNLRFMMFQPAEVVKIAYVLMLAWYLRRREDHRTLKGLGWPIVITIMPMGLLLMQPDMGSALLFPPALMAMLIAAGARLRHVFTFLGVGLAAVVFTIGTVIWAPEVTALFMKPHQVARLKSMVSNVQGDDRFAKSSGYQQAKSKDLIGAGGVLGRGMDESAVMLKHNRLPEQHNDMIFAVIVNRWGLLGGGVVVGLYTLMFLGILAIGGATKDPFARLATVGIAACLFAQVFINVGMCIGLSPITGLTLPFISYGGSSLLTSFMIVGLMMNFASDKTRIIGKTNFDYREHEPSFRYP
jgi:rod shape determining protein RodA